MQKLLAFIDFSETTGALVHAATQIALAFKMKLVLMHVSTPEADSEGQQIRTDVSRRGVATEMNRLHRALHVISVGTSKLGIDTTALLVRGTSVRGNPVPKMLKEAARHRPALIVMGTHGHGRLHEALLGSASSAIIRKAKCPVLLIPSRYPKFLWPDVSLQRRHS